MDKWLRGVGFEAGWPVDLTPPVLKFYLTGESAVDDEIDCYVQANAPLCPPGECKDFWSHTDQDGVTVLVCGWCGQTQLPVGESGP